MCVCVHSLCGVCVCVHSLTHSLTHSLSLSLSLYSTHMIRRNGNPLIDERGSQRRMRGRLDTVERKDDQGKEAIG